MIGILLGFIAGLVIGYLYTLSWRLLQHYGALYLIILMVLQGVVMFYAGSKVGGGRGSAYKPFIQGRVQQLTEGDKILQASMRRVGLVREREGGR